MAGSFCYYRVFVLMPKRIHQKWRIAGKQFRSGTSLVELVIFTAFFALASGSVLVLLFGTGEQRKRQEGIALVDQTGVQLLQTIGRRVRAAERLLDPAVANSGSVLALQMATQADDPTIFVVQSGALMAAEYDEILPLSNSGDLVISNFVVRNTSPAYDRPSVHISFTLTKSLGIPSQPTYARDFESLVTLYPDDQEQGNACSCTAPSCVGGIYQWQYCVIDTCTDSPDLLPCE